MGVLLRLSALVIAACLVLAMPASAEETPPCENDSCSGTESAPSSAGEEGNSTTEPDGNATAADPDSNSTRRDGGTSDASRDGKGGNSDKGKECDLVRGTGSTTITITVNPVLGLIVINLNCLMTSDGIRVHQGPATA